MNKRGIFLKGFAKGAKLPLLAKAVPYAFKLHENQKRDDGKDYINHPFGSCIFLINCGVEDDVTLTVTVLHDTLEDTKASYRDLLERFGKEVADRVGFLTKIKGMPLDEYFGNINDIKTMLAKFADRVDNMNDMARCFTVQRMEKAVNETTTYIVPMIRKARDLHPEYAGQLNSIKTNIEGIINTAKRIIEETNKTGALKSS